MKIKRDKMFFSKDLIHTLAYVGMFVAAVISVGACKSGIWVAAILAWIVSGLVQSMYSERNANKNSSGPKESGPKYSSQPRKSR